MIGRCRALVPFRALNAMRRAIAEPFRFEYRPAKSFDFGLERCPRSSAYGVASADVAARYADIAAPVLNGGWCRVTIMTGCTDYVVAFVITQPHWFQNPAVLILHPRPKAHEGCFRTSKAIARTETADAFALLNPVRLYEAVMPS